MKLTRSKNGNLTLVLDHDDLERAVSSYLTARGVRISGPHELTFDAYEDDRGERSIVFDPKARLTDEDSVLGDPE